MIKVKLRDELVVHDKHYFKDSNNIKFDRGTVNNGDIVIYTNRNFNEYYPNAKFHIALLMESIQGHYKYYQYIKSNHKKYDIIFTWSKSLLDLNYDNIKLNLCGTTWLHQNYRRIYDKSKLCSIIASKKNYLNGHKLRHNIINVIINNKINIDLFGGRFNNLPYSKDPNPKTLSNGKIMALKDYMFSITIENCKEDYEFTEKLIDCFLSGTVPIYWGCPSIELFFNIKGIITFNTMEECINILNNISGETYKNMLPFIKENFETAKKYCDFKIDENEIMRLINKKKKTL